MWLLWCCYGVARWLLFCCYVFLGVARVCYCVARCFYGVARWLL